MKLLAILALFVALAASTPTSKEINTGYKVTIRKEFFTDELKIHTAEHEIIKLFYPVNFDADTKSILFFVEADVTNGIEYKGLSVYKNNKTTKILPTGTSAAYSFIDLTNIIYFGATDGLYKYNKKDNKAEKYGPITDNIIDIAKVHGVDIIYILTDKNELFKVTEDGTKKDKIADVVGAKQIVLDYSNNLYYYGQDKKLYVVNYWTSQKIEIEGLPSDPTYIKLLNPAFVGENGIPIVLDNKTYIMYRNGSSELSNTEFEVKPSAYSMGYGRFHIQYYAYNKSIYAYDILALVIGKTLDDIQNIFVNTNILGY